jgi:FAD/FMN-containing dehydrogenase
MAITETMNETDMKSLVAELGKIVGPKNVLDRVEGRKKIKGDMSWLTYIHEHYGKPLCRQDAVVTPHTTAEVAAIVKLANKRPSAAARAFRARPTPRAAAFC